MHNDDLRAFRMVKARRWTRALHVAHVGEKSVYGESCREDVGLDREVILKWMLKK